MKLYYVANARMPSEKAHGIQIAKMAEAFIEKGIDLTLLIPSRGKKTQLVSEYYSLRTEVLCIRIPVPDLYLYGKYGFFLSSLIFMCGYSLFFLGKKLRGESFLIYSVDMDTYSYALLPLFANTSIEMHSPKNRTMANRFFFSRVANVIATNTLIGSALKRVFDLPDSKIIVARNGFDSVTPTLTKEEAREKLGLSSTQKIALYVGRVLSWKGIDILPRAIEGLPAEHVCYFVGGTTDELQGGVPTLLPDTLIAVGEKPFHEIPVWLAAADVGIVLGTKENESSYRYTSPMKVLEYMGAHLPIVASRTPALEDVLSEQEAFFYSPDDSSSLHETLLYALDNEQEASMRAERAYQRAQGMSWEQRAEQIRLVL